MSNLFRRANAIIPLAPAADYTAKVGYLITFASGVGTVTAAAATFPTGVILEPPLTSGTTTETMTVGILGALAGTVQLKCGGAITKGDKVKQHTDGTIVTNAAGERYIVGTALETGVTGDLIEVATHAPLYLAS